MGVGEEGFPYTLPLEQPGYSDMREGLVPPMRLHLTSPCFGKDYESAARDILAPRAYLDRPSAADVLKAFSLPPSHPASVASAAAAAAAAAAAPLMTSPPPSYHHHFAGVGGAGAGAGAVGGGGGSGGVEVTALRSEVGWLRARVAQLEAAAAAAAGGAR